MEPSKRLKRTGPQVEPQFNFCNETKGSLQMAEEGDYLRHLNDDSIYPVKHKTKGCALIINNNFGGDREGSEIDVKNMENLWQGLGCHIHCGETQWDKSADEMIALLTEMTSLESGKYDFVVIVMMSHGGIIGGEEKRWLDKDNKLTSVQTQAKEVVYGNDSNHVEVEKIMEMFNNDKAKKLQSIPKLFLFQFCRGSSADVGVTAMDTKPMMDAGSLLDTAEVRIPIVTDMLVAYPARNQYTALRGQKGSWFINAVTNVFLRYAKEEHVADMLTRVNSWMAESTGQVKYKEDETTVTYLKCKAMSNYHSSLRKKLFLFPGFPKEDLEETDPQ